MVLSKIKAVPASSELTLGPDVPPQAWAWLTIPSHRGAAYSENMQGNGHLDSQEFAASGKNDARLFFKAFFQLSNIHFEHSQQASPVPGETKMGKNQLPPSKSTFPRLGRLTASFCSLSEPFRTTARS